MYTKYDNEQFKTEYTQKPMQDDEYKNYLILWMEYRSLTHFLPKYQNKEAHKIYKRLFQNLPKTEKYQQAKIDSLRLYENEEIP